MKNVEVSWTFFGLDELELIPILARRRRLRYQRSLAYRFARA